MRDRAPQDLRLQANQSVLLRLYIELEAAAIVAHSTTLAELQSRVNDDPFVAQKVVGAEILEITQAKADERLSFLIG